MSPKTNRRDLNGNLSKNVSSFWRKSRNLGAALAQKEIQQPDLNLEYL